MLRVVILIMLSLCLNSVFASNSNNLHAEEERPQTKALQAPDILTLENLFQDYDYGDKKQLFFT